MLAVNLLRIRSWQYWALYQAVKLTGLDKCETVETETILHTDKENLLFLDIAVFHLCASSFSSFSSFCAYRILKLIQKNCHAQ